MNWTKLHNNSEPINQSVSDKLEADVRRRLKYYIGFW
jgi:hypothetical protein